MFHLREARRWLEAGIAFATELEIDFYLNYATAWLALTELYLGHWDAAATHAANAVAAPVDRPPVA